MNHHPSTPHHDATDRPDRRWRPRSRRGTSWLGVVAMFAVIVTASTVGSFAPASADANEASTAIASAIQGRISAGGSLSCAVLDDGAVRCWGSNYHGQLGSTVNNYSDVANPTPQPAVALGCRRSGRA